MTPQTIDNYRLTSMVEPSDEVLAQLMHEALVETNDETGETHLRIPVPDKQTVSTLLSFVGKLFAK